MFKVSWECAERSTWSGFRIRAGQTGSEPPTILKMEVFREVKICSTEWVQREARRACQRLATEELRIHNVTRHSTLERKGVLSQAGHSWAGDRIHWYQDISVDTKVSVVQWYQWFILASHIRCRWKRYTSCGKYWWPTPSLFSPSDEWTFALLEQWSKGSKIT